MKELALYGASNRPENWLWFYDNVKDNTTDFEIVFVGDVRPTFTLPDRMRFIYSEVKPAQCHHIAIMESNAEFCMQACDDVWFSPQALDIAYGAYKKQNDYRTMTGPRVSPPGEAEGGLQWSAYMGGFSKQFYKEIGGFDNRFIRSQHETDLQFRMLIEGGTMVWLIDAWWTESAEHDGVRGDSNGCSDNAVGRIDWFFLEDLWFEVGIPGVRRTFTAHRADEVIPYVDDELLTKSQGITGRWNESKTWDRYVSYPPLVTPAPATQPNMPDTTFPLKSIIARFNYKSIGQGNDVIQSKPVAPPPQPSGENIPTARFTITLQNLERDVNPLVIHNEPLLANLLTNIPHSIG